MEDKDFKKIFLANKIDIPDKSFSERVVKGLPERKSILPQIVVMIFTMVGLVLTFAIQGITPIFEQIKDLLNSISRMQAPSPISVIIFLVTMTVVGSICYSIMQADEV